MTENFERLRDALADRYQIERELGAGGMATVYVARDLKHNREVAVKVLRPELAAVLGAERFVNEIEVTAGLQHPHILPLFDSGDADGFLFYVMPLVEGESLADKLQRERQLPIEESLDIARQVAAALEYAHKRGVVHRDIKPDNIMLSSGEVIVADFGIARAIDAAGGEQLTATGAAIGTPAYMSPEQAAGDREVDGRTDVYALGCVLYEMLAGEPPFTGNSVQAVIAKRLTESAPNVMTLRDTVPREVSESLAKALARSAADRHSSAAAFAASLVQDRTVAIRIASSSAGQPHPLRTAALFGMASVVTLAGVYVMMLQFGLPDWVFQAAVTLVIIGLPLIVATALTERQRTGRSGPERPRWLNWRRALQGGGLAFGGLTVVTVVFMVSRALGIGPAATLMASGTLELRDPILLADFENRTSDATLGETITRGLRIDLSQSRVVRVVEPATVAGAKQRMLIEADAPLDEALARQIAEREGVKAVLAGDISSVGTGYMLSARLVAPVDGALLGAERVSAGSDSELIAAIDELSARLRARIGESLKDVRDSPPLFRVTTSSLDALRKFTEALRLDQEGDWQGARLRLEEAVVLDTTFAMAYRKLGVTGPPGGRRTEAGQAALTRAFELREHLPTLERHNIEAIYYSLVDHDAQKAESAYRATLAIDSNDYLALNNLASRMSRTRQWAVQESLATRAIDQAGIWQAYDNVISAQLHQGKIDDARATLARFSAANPESPFIVTWELWVLRATRQYDRAEAVLRERLSDPAVAGSDRQEAMEGLGDLLWLGGRVGEAERWYREWMEAERGPDRFRATYDLATLLAMLGRSNEAVRLMEGFPVDSGPPLDRPYLALAEFHAANGRPDQAERLLAQHDSIIPAGFLKHPFRQQYIHQVAGEVALAEGRFGDAVGEFRTAHEMAGACVTCGLARMAYAFLRNGQPDSALVVYRRLASSPTNGRLDEVDMSWLPISYQRLGELYEARNDTANAVNAYNEFVELWKDADPELQPQVADVRRRIARLVGEPGS